MNAVPVTLPDLSGIPDDAPRVELEVTICRTCCRSAGWVQQHPEPEGGEDPRLAWSADHYDETGHRDFSVWYLNRSHAQMWTVPARRK